MTIRFPRSRKLSHRIGQCALALAIFPGTSCHATDTETEQPKSITIRDGKIDGHPVQVMTVADRDAFIQQTWAIDAEAQFAHSIFDVPRIKTAQFLIALNRMEDTTCGDHAISITEIAANGAEKSDSAAVEIWFLDICGKKLRYLVRPGTHVLQTDLLYATASKAAS